MWNAVGRGSKERHHVLLTRLWEYLRWERFKPEPVLPPSKAEVLEFITDKGEKVKSQTIMNWISALKSGLADTGADVSYFESRDFELFRRGVRRVKGETKVRNALPLTLPVLSAVNASLLRDLPTRRQVVLAAAFAVAFACFLRSGEFTYDFFDPELDFQRKDLIVRDGRYALRLKSSKMDQTRKGEILALPRIDDARFAHVCPSSLLQRLLTDYPDYPESPLFSFSALRGQQRFDKASVVRELRAALAASGFGASVDGRTYSGHSFRRGAATWASRVGLSDNLIRRLGRWSPSGQRGSCPRYIEIRDCDLAAALQRMYDPAFLRTGSGTDVDACGTGPWDDVHDDLDFRRVRR